MISVAGVWLFSGLSKVEPSKANTAGPSGWPKPVCGPAGTVCSELTLDQCAPFTLWYPYMEEAPQCLHARLIGILDVLYFCLIQQAGAGWLQACSVWSLSPETGWPVQSWVLQSWDSNQGASRCQENHAHSGPGLVPSVTSALHRLLCDSVTKCSLRKPQQVFFLPVTQEWLESSTMFTVCPEWAWDQHLITLDDMNSERKI